MKVLIIGNSHIASLKRAWEQSKHKFTTDISLKFAGARGRHLQDLLLSCHSIAAPNGSELSKGFSYTFGSDKISISPSDFDKILLYGCGLSPSIFSGFNPIFGRFFSRQSKNTAILDYFEGLWGFGLAKRLSKSFGRPLLISCPIAANRDISCNDAQWPTKYESEKAEFLWLSEEVRDANELVLRRFDIEFLMQPHSTIDAQSYATLPIFTSGSSRLAIGDRHDHTKHEVDDKIHMNELFGEQFLRLFFDRIGSEVA